MTGDPLSDPRNYLVGRPTPGLGAHRWPVNTSAGRKTAVATRTLASGQVVVTCDDESEWTPTFETPHLLSPYVEGEG
jgi:hypothetical protein